MSVIENDQRDGSSTSSEKNGSDFQFYGGIVWKQVEYTSEYHYNFAAESSVVDAENQNYINKREPVQFFNFKTMN